MEAAPSLPAGGIASVGNWRGGAPWRKSHPRHWRATQMTHAKDTTRTGWRSAVPSGTPSHPHQRRRFTMAPTTPRTRKMRLGPPAFWLLFGSGFCGVAKSLDQRDRTAMRLGAERKWFKRLPLRRDRDTIHYSMVYQAFGREIDGIFTISGDTTLSHDPYEVYVEGFRTNKTMLVEYANYDGERCRLSGSSDILNWYPEFSCAGLVTDTLHLRPVSGRRHPGTLKVDDEAKDAEIVQLYDLDRNLLDDVYTSAKFRRAVWRFSWVGIQGLCE